MLNLTGKCLGIKTEEVDGPTGSFIKKTIYVLDGFESRGVSVGREFPPADLPRDGEDISLEVVVSAFSRRAGGAGVQITALSRVKAGARVAPVANAS